MDPGRMLADIIESAPAISNCKHRGLLLIPSIIYFQFIITTILFLDVSAKKPNYN